MSRKIDPRRIEVVDKELAAVLRRKSPMEKVAMIDDANHTARMLAAAGIRYQYPDWNDEQIHAEVIRRVCGETERPS